MLSCTNNSPAGTEHPSFETGTQKDRGSSKAVAGCPLALRRFSFFPEKTIEKILYNQRDIFEEEGNTKDASDQQLN
jgi:hypothetical protein